LGKDPLDLVFPAWRGGLQNPEHFTKAFSREVVAAGIARVTFHGLRHTHLTHLLLDGVPVHVVSARAGHANPTVTLNVYSHMLPGAQDEAAAITDAALKAALHD
jgi:integrase